MTESDWQRACYDDVAGQLAEARDEVERLRSLLERTLPFLNGRIAAAEFVALLDEIEAEGIVEA